MIDTGKFLTKFLLFIIHIYFKSFSKNNNRNSIYYLLFKVLEHKKIKQSIRKTQFSKEA